MSTVTPPSEPQTPSTAASVDKEPLPLDWTRVKRKHQDSDADCCDDPATCRRRRLVRPRLVPSSKKPVIRGRVVFCLHDTDSSWLQGYFIPRGSKKPWGLLAVQEEIDECLACLDGGYRRISLTVYHQRRKSLKLQSIDWTGGDMMALAHPDLEMETDRLYTGKSALPYLNQYFQSMIIKIQKQCEVDEDTPILDWLPDVAIIVGSMSLILPRDDEDDDDF